MSTTICNIGEGKEGKPEKLEGEARRGRRKRDFSLRKTIRCAKPALR